MNLLLNASNLRHGGGKTVALQLLHAIAPLRPNDKLYVLAPDDPGYKALTKYPNVTLLPLPEAFQNSWLSKLWQMHRAFPGWCNRLKIDKVISLGNAAFPAGGRPQLVYIQLPQLVYHESQAWKMMEIRAFLRNSLMDQYVALHMRYATSYAMQTEVMRTRLLARFRLPEDRVFILPNAPVEPEDTEISPLPELTGPLKLLFLSRYYPHKHFECLPALARILRDRNIPVEITLTISKDEASGAAKVLERLHGLTAIRNIGPVPIAGVGSLMRSHHGIFLPSLMESFSGAYAEALLHRRLIFTSQLDFATSLLGDAAFYFDPLRPEHIAEVLETAVKNPGLIRDKLPVIEAAALAAPRIRDVAATFSHIIDTFA